MYRRVSVSVVHGVVEVIHDDAFLRAVFQVHTDIIGVLNPCKSCHCIGIEQEAVVVSLYKDDLTVKAFNQFRGIIVSGFPDHVPEDISEVALSDFIVPSADEFRIHFFDCLERSIVKGEYILMTEVQVTGKIYFTHRLSSFLTRPLSLRLIRICGTGCASCQSVC